MSTAWIIVIVCLWLVVVGLVVVVAGVLRKVAVALESRIPDGPAAGRRIGPIRGTVLPGITLGAPDAGTIALSQVPGPFVLAVLTSHCAPCLAIAGSLRTDPDRLHGAGRLVVVTDRSGRAVIDLDGCATVLTDDENVALEALDIPGTPFVVDVDAEGRVAASSLLSGPDQLLSMLGAPQTDRGAGLPVQVVG